MSESSARGFAKSFVPKNTLGILAQYVMMKVLLRDAWIGLFCRQFGAESLLMPPLTERWVALRADQGGANVSPS